MNRTMSPDAERIWQLSEEYVALASKHLGIFNPRIGMLPCNDGQMEHMRAMFLFPCMTNEQSRREIEAARAMLLSTKRWQEKGKDHPNDPNYSSEYGEAMAEQVAAKLRQSLFAFSPVQQEILRAHYLLPDVE